MKSIELLWAPWRVEYIKGKKPRGCVLCSKTKDRGGDILYRSKYSFVVLNKYPYNSGHLMVFPKRHLKDIDGLSGNEMADLINSLKLSIRALKKGFGPHGFNIGMNIGRVAGAGIAGHLHIHVVPRWNGDTNFMPVLAETRVIPEHLKSTYLRLKEYF